MNTWRCSPASHPWPCSGTPTEAHGGSGATDNPLYDQQEGRFFRGYDDAYCYLPLCVFCGHQLLCAYLRPSRIDGAKHTAAILKLLVARMRRQWPRVRIVLALQGTVLAKAQVDTLRIKLLKLAAVVTRNTRRIRLYLASNWPAR